MSGSYNGIIYGVGIDLSGAYPPTNELGTDGFLLIGNTAGATQGAALTRSEEHTSDSSHIPLSRMPSSA